MQNSFFIRDHDRVPGIVSALKTHDNICFFCEMVDDFCFSLIAPLNSYQNGVLHVSPTSDLILNNARLKKRDQLTNHGLLNCALSFDGLPSKSAFIPSDVSRTISWFIMAGGELNERKIGSAVYYPIPLHLQQCFAAWGYAPGSLPATEQACREVLSLPIYECLTRDEQDVVITTIADFCGVAIKSAARAA